MSQTFERLLSLLSDITGHKFDFVEPPPICWQLSRIIVHDARCRLCRPYFIMSFISVPAIVLCLVSNKGFLFQIIFLTCKTSQNYFKKWKSEIGMGVPWWDWTVQRICVSISPKFLSRIDFRVTVPVPNVGTGLPRKIRTFGRQSLFFI